MKIGKYDLRLETLNIIWQKHVRPLWDPRIRENTGWNKRFLVLTNNSCNLQCWNCSALCDLPVGSTPFTWKRHITPLGSIEKFLSLIDGYRPDHWIKISGGEPTLCGPEYLEELTEICHNHNRKVSLLTNAARVQDCDPHWFEYIHLDEHIVNEQRIRDTVQYFKKTGFKRYQIWKTKTHRDLGLQRRNHITNGLKCEEWMAVISLWRDTVYPCCVTPFLDGWNRNTLIRESLNRDGWTIDNPDLVHVLEDNRETTPPQVAYACQLQCWKDGPNVESNPVSGNVELVIDEEFVSSEESGRYIKNEPISID